VHHNQGNAIPAGIALLNAMPACIYAMPAEMPADSYEIWHRGSRILYPFHHAKFHCYRYNK